MPFNGFQLERISIAEDTLLRERINNCRVILLEYGPKGKKSSFSLTEHEKRLILSGLELIYASPLEDI